MLSILRRQRGFSLAEVLIVIALLGILASVVLINLGSSDTKAKERALEANLQAVRAGIDLYRSDHGHYPCSSGDADYPCTDQQLRDKLLLYTDNAGQTSTSKTTQYKYGPYLKDFPMEPFSQSDSLTWSLTTERVKSVIATAIAAGSGNGGWYYEPESGNIVANLGSTFPSEYAGF